MQKEYFLIIKGEKVRVSEEVYKSFWSKVNREKYLRKIDLKNHLFVFSTLDYDGHFIENIVDERADVEKIIQTKMIIDEVRQAIAKLTPEERELVERLYYKEESIRSIAKLKSLSPTAICKRRDKILYRLRKLMENYK